MSPTHCINIPTNIEFYPTSAFTYYEIYFENLVKFSHEAEENCKRRVFC